MSKYELLIKAVTIQGLSYGQVARLHGVSKTLVHKLHHRWLVDGEAAFEPQSRRPRSSPGRTSPEVVARVLELRDQLTADGHDAGADTILELLARDGITVSRATIWRLLKVQGKIVPQPQKRPRSSWQRFAADRPNELWQSDFTHVLLTTGADVEVIGWIDDHSRYLLHLTAHPRVTGRIVIDTFTSAATEHGYPAATLTDNGMVYTTRYARNARGIAPGNGFETLLALQGIIQKNGRPFKPTTQGKIERFWQTLKRHLAAHPADTIDDLQNTLDSFRHYYNQQRPHRALGRRTPEFAYQLIPKAAPTTPDDPDLWRVRYDTIDTGGRITLRYGGRLLHLGIGRAHARTQIICLVHNLDATIIDNTTGVVLAEFTLKPTNDYQSKNG
ncbi:MAG: IS481 family transposase [Rhodoglobus sp.]|nr:IS481 family transposase [Rhodoglobus sp.]